MTLKKRTKGGICLPDISTYNKAIGRKTIWCGCKDRHMGDGTDQQTQAQRLSHHRSTGKGWSA